MLKILAIAVAVLLILVSAVAFFALRTERGARFVLDQAVKQLDGKLRELRFYVERDAVRVTYWIAPGRRIILLTAFRKTRMRDGREVERARRALARCIAEQHTVDEETDDE